MGDQSGTGSLPPNPSKHTFSMLQEKLGRPQHQTPKRSWKKLALIALAILIPLIVLVVCLAVLLPRRHSKNAPATAKLDYGTYQGTRLSAGVDQYLGIRFAAPPTGTNRWRAPQPPQRFSGTQNATDFQPICLGVSAGLPASQSEDCLFANVYTPSNATTSSKLPVWVYIQGGGYAGDNNANYNGTQVVQTGNVVLVNFNYRVGSWGFLAGEKVRSDGDLNAGLLDQRAAFNWTRNYIAAFGGDPDHIIIHGASAGAGAVGHHLVAYGGRNDNLFVGAIAQSPFYQDEMTVSELEWQFQIYTNNTGCDTATDMMSCLRGKDVQILQKADYSSPFPGHHDKPRHAWGPTIDGDFFTDYPISLFNQGKFIPVPLMVGDEPDEGTLFAPNASTAQDVRQFFNVNYPKLTQTQLTNITDQYPKGDPVPKHAAYFGPAAQAYGESTLICPGMWMLDAMSAKNASSVWTYSFNVSTADDWANGLGAFHTIDTGAIFGPDYDGADMSASSVAYTQTNAPVVPVLMNYYLSFVKNLDPNVGRDPSAPSWMGYKEGDGRRRLKIEVGDYVMEDVPAGLITNCDFWKELQVAMEL